MARKNWEFDRTHGTQVSFPREKSFTPRYSRAPKCNNLCVFLVLGGEEVFYTLAQVLKSRLLISSCKESTCLRCAFTV